MARYCSAQDNVRPRQSPPYRETIRVNVLHGRKSMSYAKSVLPLFTGAASETFRKVPDRVQIDTTLNRQNCIQNHPVKGRRPGLNRTAVCCYAKSDKQWIADPQGVPWDTFLTYGDSTVYGEGSLDKLKGASEAACCASTCCEPEAIQVAPKPAAARACCAR